MKTDKRPNDTVIAGLRGRYAALLAGPLLAFALLFAGCIGSEGAASGSQDDELGAPAASESPPATGNDTSFQDQEPGALAFAQCMRANGVPNFPDPMEGGGMRITGDVAQNPNFDPARIACEHLIPEGGMGGAGQLDPEVMLAFAQCMRENGIPDFPDDLGGGGGQLGSGPGGIDASSPQFQAAIAVCGPEHGIQINVR